MVYRGRLGALDWFFMNKASLEKVAILLSSVVVVVAIIFWVAQVGDVIETLCLAYGDWCFSDDS